MDKPKFTKIMHDIKEELKLSVNEYMVADSIDTLSNNPKYGWCIMSQEKMGEFLGLSRETINKIIKRLVIKGLIEKNESTKYVRTTQLWYDSTAIYSEDKGVKQVHKGCEASSQKGVKQVHSRCEASSHNNNNIDLKDNNKDSNISGSKTSSSNTSKKQTKILGIDPYEDIAYLLKDKIIANNSKQANRITSWMIRKWTEDIRLLVEKDGETIEDVKKVIIWCQDISEFWKTVILTGKKLREKYPQLYQQMISEKGSKKSDITGDPNKKYEMDEQQLKKWLWWKENGMKDGPGDAEYLKQIKERHIVLTDKDREYFNKEGV